MSEPSARMKRQDARRAAGSKTKPYAKISKTVSPSSSEELVWPLDAFGPAGNSDSVSKPGFPTNDQYKQIEAAYLASLSPRKRDKALITQAMFDNIWDILHDPDTREIQTAQFRFWVRKMFVLSDPQPTQVFTSGDSCTRISSVPVILHENRPVAIKEQLYELFVYCHGLSNHGGRDKTCSVIRKHYSWVPKELTAQFVKACPTCTLKRSGNPDLVAMVQEQVQQVAQCEPDPDSSVALSFNSESNQDVVPGQSNTSIGDRQCSNASPKKQRWPASEGPLDSATFSAQRHESKLTDNAHTSESTNLIKICLPRISSSRAIGRTLDLAPPALVREVSLFNGIPNMWNVNDLESLQARARAHNAMVDQRTGIAAQLPLGRVPRVPSIVFKSTELLPGILASYLPHRAHIDDGTKAPGDRASLPPLVTALEKGALDGEDPSWRMQVDPTNTLPSSLQPLKMTNLQALGSNLSGCGSDIDPGLFKNGYTNNDGYIMNGRSSEEQFETTEDLGITETPVNSPQANTSHAAYLTGPSLSPTKPTFRAAGPTPLNLAALQAFDFVGHRGSDGHSPTTPSSAGSCYSQLSPFDTASSTSSRPSPFATALPTPTDEHQKTAMELAEETDGLALGNKDFYDNEGNKYPWEQEGEFPTMMNLKKLSA